jgi:NAD(P)-dependent dehydrogenase (short-subunit alcohol dehydrogenase family)
MTSTGDMSEGRVAVITGAVSGIGLAAATRFAAMGLRVCIADISADALEQAAVTTGGVAKHGSSDVLAAPTDVSDPDAVHRRLRNRVRGAFGEVAVLMNNAGTAPGRRSRRTWPALPPGAGLPGHTFTVDAV